MASEYIATHSNRIYLKSETDHPAMGDMSEAVLAPVTSLRVNTRRQQLFRQDKTGFRTDTPVLGPQRELIEVSLGAYGVGWDGGATKTAISPLLESGFSAQANVGANYTVAAVAGATLTLGEDSTLTVGAALLFGTELRFVTAVSGLREVTLNAPFTVEPSLGATLQGCLNLGVGDATHTMSLLDNWNPSQAVQRFLTGVVANRLTVAVNNDFLDLSVDGFARNQYDSVNGVVSGEFTFPTEPAGTGSLLASPIAGHLGQAVVGVDHQNVCTLTEATITIDNNIEPRTDEFGCYTTKAYTLGKRRVTVDFTLFERNDAFSQSLYAQAVNNVPVPVMFQLGTQPGAMLGIYLPAVLLSMPEFDDRQSRLLWRFQGSLALGGQNDEIFLAQR
ncbi:MAG: phage tail tube protein [Bryobacter sp.]|nr:phage tail tube protein [Bryobacter sp.]